jgi:hypothetical protein
VIPERRFVAAKTMTLDRKTRRNIDRVGKIYRILADKRGLLVELSHKS